jgi:hypothetical protein
MKALVVFESPVVGTSAEAEKIAASLRTKGVDADVIPVDQLDPTLARSVDLLIIGGPAHAHETTETSYRGAGATGEKTAWKRSGGGPAHPSDTWSTLVVVRPRSSRRQPRTSRGVSAADQGSPPGGSR